jgi:hypothetical protein
MAQKASPLQLQHNFLELRKEEKRLTRKQPA